MFPPFGSQSKFLVLSDSSNGSFPIFILHGILYERASYTHTKLADLRPVSEQDPGALVS